MMNINLMIFINIEIYKNSQLFKPTRKYKYMFRNDKYWIILFD